MKNKLTRNEKRCAALAKARSGNALPFARLLAAVLALVFACTTFLVALNFVGRADDEGTAPGGTASIEHPEAVSENDLVLEKYLTKNDDDTYNLTLESYSTGSTITQELESDVPLDIVLVIDQSGSMLTPDMASSTGYEASTKDWTVDQALGWYMKDGEDYYELKAETGPIYSTYLNPVLSDSLMGVTGESLHTSWNSWATPYLVQDENGIYVPLYVQTKGYLGGYDAQFYYYPEGSSSAIVLPFNSASGSTTASYSRGGIGTGSMNDNSNRLWARVFSKTTITGNNRLYYLKNDEKVYVGNQVNYSSETALSNVTLYYRTTSNMTRLDALRSAAGKFVQSIGDRAAQTGADHRVAVVGFASNEVPSTSFYTDSSGNDVDIPYSHILGSSRYVTQNTGLFVNQSFKNYITPNLTSGSSGLGNDINHNTSLYSNITYFYKYSNTYFPMVYSYSDSRWFDVFAANDGTLGCSWIGPSSSDYNSNNYIVYKGTTLDYPYSDNLVYYPAVTELSQPDYQNALVKINQNDNDANHVNDDLDWAVSHVDAYGGTYLSYGMAMANNVFKYNDNVETINGKQVERKRIVVVFTDGQPGGSGFEEAIANEAKAAASVAKDTYGAAVYTVGLYPNSLGKQVDDFMHELSSEYFTTTTNVYAPDMNNSATYYFDDANGRTHAATFRRNTYTSGSKTYNTQPKWTNQEVGNRTIPITSDTGGNYTQAIWADSDGWLRGAKYSADDTRTGPNDNIWQFYSVEEATATYKGTYYYPASNAGQLSQVFQTISESIQSPFTTIKLDSVNSVLKDVISDSFEVDTSSSASNVTFALAKSEDGGETFQKVESPNDSEQTILNGLSYTWSTTNTSPVLNVLNVTGFDYSQNYVAEGHMGYKLLTTIHSIAPKEKEVGRLYSNTADSGIYRQSEQDELITRFPQPAIQVDPKVFGITSTFTYTGWAATKTFPVTYTLTDSNGGPISGTYGEYTFNEQGNCTVNMANADVASGVHELTLTGLPKDSKLTVTVTPPDAASYTYSISDSNTSESSPTGTFTVDSDKRIAISVTETLSKVTITNTLTGTMTNPKDEFPIQLSLKNGDTPVNGTFYSADGNTKYVFNNGVCTEKSTKSGDNWNTSEPIKLTGEDTGNSMDILLPKGCKLSIEDGANTPSGYETTYQVDSGSSETDCQDVELTGTDQKIAITRERNLPIITGIGEDASSVAPVLAGAAGILALAGAGIAVLGRKRSHF